jgi:hypothetical protein
MYQILYIIDCVDSAQVYVWYMIQNTTQKIRKKMEVRLLGRPKRSYEEMSKCEVNIKMHLRNK